MTGTVLILGAQGRFGRAATQAFASAGWQVRAASRAGDGPHLSGVTRVACDVSNRDALVAAAQGADVIVQAAHPLYHQWAELMPVQTANVIAAGLASGATVMIPGNVYTFGAQAPTLLQEGNAPAPTTRKGAIRLEMERSFAEAADQGLRTIILRSGDFMMAQGGGTWFDSHIAHKARSGSFTYPGRMDAVHAWAYLPDVARATVALANKRDTFAPFTTLGFEGFSLTGAELRAAVAKAVSRPLKVKSMPWGIVRIMGLFSPVLREVMEMRYLWDTPHRIDGRALRAALPEFVPTPLDVAMTHLMAPSRKPRQHKHGATARSA